MASPFHIFRKYQRTSLAVITFLAMVAFVFSGLLTRAANNQSDASKEPVEATWSFGKITKNEVSRHMEWATALNNFLAKACDMAGKKGAILLQRPPMFPDKDRNLTLTLIVLAKKAETMGIVVSDKAINDYIDGLTDHKLTKEDKENLVAGQTGGRSAGNSDQLFEELRFQLLADRMSRLLFSDSLDIGTPAGQWNYFCRVARQAKIEAMPVEVKNFVSQVPDPAEEKLQAFFEKYKAALPYAGSPDPGFKIPAKGEFQYFEAVQADFAKQEKSKVTDAQIKEYYDDHKEQFRRTVFDFEDKTRLIAPEKETPKPDAKTEPKPPSGDKPKTDEKSKTDDKSKSPLTPKATDKEKPAASNKAGDKTPDKPKSDKAGDKTPDKSKTDKPTDDKGPTGKSSRSDRSRSGEATPVENVYGRSSPTELLAFADPEKSDKANTKSEPAKTAPANPAPAKTEPAKTEPAKTEPAKADPAKTEPAKKSPSKDAATAPAKGETSDKNGGKSASGTPAGKTPADAKSDASEHEKYSEYDSVDNPKVRDQIIDNLAGEAAAKKIGEVFIKLRPKVSKYSTELAKWRAKGSVAADKPAPPDFKAIAKDFGVEFGQTGLVSAQESVEKKGVGKSYSFIDQGEMRYRNPFELQAFASTLKVYQTEESSAGDGETDYLWWKAQDLTPAKVPDSLDAVRDEVVLAWKMIEARKLAEAKANEYMAEVNRRHVSLKEAFGFKPGMPKILEPPPFPWLTQRSVPASTEMEDIPPVLSKVKDIDLVGPEFMATVFGLEVGSAGVSFNEPRTVAYVVQLQDIQPRETALRAEFLRQIVNPADPLVRQAYLAANEESRQIMRGKIQAIEKEFDFQVVAPSGDNQSAAPVRSGDEDD